MEANIKELKIENIIEILHFSGVHFGLFFVSRSPLPQTLIRISKQRAEEEGYGAASAGLDFGGEGHAGRKRDAAIVSGVCENSIAEWAGAQAFCAR